MTTELIGGFLLGKNMSKVKCLLNKFILSPWLVATMIMIGIWGIFGIYLIATKDHNFITNLLSAGSTIGTIGAMITALYLSNRKFNYKKAINVLEPLNQRHSYLDITCQNQTNIIIQINKAIAYNAYDERINIIHEYIGKDEFLYPHELKVIYLQNTGGEIYSANEVSYFLFVTNLGFYKVKLTGECEYYGFTNRETKNYY